MGKIYQYKAMEMEFKDIDPSSMTVAGYFSAFNKLDSYNEITEPGAFKKSLSENMSRVRFLLNHDINKSLGSFNDLREDEYGLFYHATVLPTSFGKDFMIMVEGGIIREHSIGYQEVKAEDKEGVRYVKEVKLYEGSALTGWGVNQFTPMVPVFKSELDASKRIKELEAFCRNTTATDETIQMLMIEIKQLNQAIIDIKTTQPAPAATVPASHELNVGLVKTFISLLN